MKKIHCISPHPSRKTRDFTFVRYFSIDTNPRMSWHFDREKQQWRIDYVPKHFKSMGRIAWDSWRNGTVRKSMDKNGKPFYYPENNTKPRRAPASIQL